MYLSDISPLGVPFNNLRNNTKDKEKETLINNGRPGSACPKRFVALNKEFSEEGICTASRHYQRLKIKELDTKNISPLEYKNEYGKIIEKTCTCVGLGTSALLAHNLDTKVEGEGVSICPGPNMAYYSKVMSLKEITDHIYGRRNVITRKDRPNFFIKELNIYIEYLKDKLEDAKISYNKKQEKYLTSFTHNMKEGVSYYYKLFRNLEHTFKDTKRTILKELRKSDKALHSISLEIEKLSCK